jgi:hypothetical protein
VHCYEPDEEVFGIHPTQRIPGEDGTILIFIYNSLDELEDLHVHSNLLRGYFILCYAKALLPELILTHKYIFFFIMGRRFCHATRDQFFSRNMQCKEVVTSRELLIASLLIAGALVFYESVVKISPANTAICAGGKNYP